MKPLDHHHLEIAKSACDALGQGWAVDQCIYDTPKTLILRLIHAASGRKLAYKRYLTDDQSAAEEFAHLRQIHTLTPQGSAPLVVNPVRLNAAENALYMAWTPALNLVQYCQKHPQNRTLVMHTMGCWLARFHALNIGGDALRPTKFRPGGRLAHLRKDWEKNASEAPQQAQQRFAQIETRLKQLADASSEESVEFVFSQHDANPRNVLFHKGTLTGVDVQLGHTANRAKCLARFLMHFWIVARCENVDCPYCSAEAAALFDGYSHLPQNSGAWKFEVQFAAIRFYEQQWNARNKDLYVRTAAALDAMAACPNCAK